MGFILEFSIFIAPEIKFPFNPFWDLSWKIVHRDIALWWKSVCLSIPFGIYHELLCKLVKEPQTVLFQSLLGFIKWETRTYEQLPIIFQSLLGFIRFINDKRIVVEVADILSIPFGIYHTCKRLINNLHVYPFNPFWDLSKRILS